MPTTLAEVQAFLEREFPQALVKCDIVSLQPQGCVVRYRVDQQDLRPGGTVAGPSMMAVADFAVYVALLAHVGIEALAVTSQLNIHFLAKPNAQNDIIAECRLLKTGKRLIVGEVNVFSEHKEEPIALVTATYMRP